MINDTDFQFFENPDEQEPPPEYVDIPKCAVLWGLIILVLIWLSFIFIGWRKDVHDRQKFQQALRVYSGGGHGVQLRKEKATQKKK